MPTSIWSSFWVEEINYAIRILGVGVVVHIEKATAVDWLRMVSKEKTCAILRTIN